MDDDVVGQVQSAMETGTAPEIDTSTVETQETSPEAQQAFERDYGFLKHLDPTERPVVEKYLKSIDGNITRRFQDIHSQYAPYKELGEVEQLRNAIALQNQMQTVEWQWAAYNALKNQFKTLEQAQQGQFEEELPPQVQQQPQQPVVPPEMQIKLQQMEQLVASLAQQRVSEQQAVKQAEEDKALSSYMDQLKAEFGNFDENYVVTTAMYNGGDLVSAVQQWKQLQQQIINQASQASTAPPVLSGGQVAPPQTPRLGDLDSKDVKSLVAQSLGHLRRSS